MKAFYPYDLTEGFVDAVAVWSEYLKGDRAANEWGVAAAGRFLVDAGFGTFNQAIPQETLRKLMVLTAGAARFSTSMGPRDVAKTDAFEALAREVSPFFENNCEVKLESNLGSKSFQKMDWIDADQGTLDDVTAIIKNKYDDPASALDAVDIQAKNLYDTVRSDAANNYDRVPTDFSQAAFPQSEYDVIGQDIANSPYFEAPPPESYYEAIQAPEGAP